MGINCIKCNEPIPKIRLEAIPGVKVCVKCSRVKPMKGYMTWEHKTAPTFHFGSDKTIEYIHRNRRTNAGAKLPMDRKG